MARINAKWQRMPEKYKWVVRIGMLLLAVGNGWEWHRHTAAQNPVAAVIDALFVVLCVWFIFQSFQNRSV
jgi:hypothetical protein